MEITKLFSAFILCLNAVIYGVKSDDDKLLDYNVSFCGTFSKIGTDDFSELRVLDGAYVDKSLLLLDYLKAPNDIILVTRPRQFGKTINAKMIKSFLEIEVDENCTKLPENRQSNVPLFVGGQIRVSNNTVKKYRYLKIARYQYGMDQQGKWPAFYVSFTSVTGKNVSEIERSVRTVIDSLYESYAYLKRFASSDDPVLDPDEKLTLNDYLSKTYDREQLKDSLRFLTVLFYKIFCRKVHVIVDDFDKPVNDFYELLVREARTNLSSASSVQTVANILNDKFESNELQSVVRLLRDMFNNCFRNNEAFEKAFVTGQKRYAKADVLSDVDDSVQQYTVLHRNFSAFYGFDQEELNDLIGSWNLEGKRNSLAYEYKGYNMGGGREVYNPWSVGRFFQSGGQLQTYWLDIGSPGLLDFLLSDEEIQKRLGILAMGGSIVVNGLKTKLTFEKNNFYDSLFNELVHTGYVTPVSDAWSANEDLTRLNVEYQLVSPNRELKNIFKERVKLKSNNTDLINASYRLLSSKT